MSLQLFGHPFSSYTWKVLIALWADETPFEFRMLGPDHPENGDELRRRWPFGLWRGKHGTGSRSRCTFFGSVALTSR